MRGAAKTDALTLERPTSSGTGQTSSTATLAKAAFNPSAHGIYTVFILQHGSPQIRTDALPDSILEESDVKLSSHRVYIPDNGQIFYKGHPTSPTGVYDFSTLPQNI